MQSKDIKVGEELVHTWSRNDTPHKVKVMGILEGARSRRFKVRFLHNSHEFYASARELQPLDRWDELVHASIGPAVIRELAEELKEMGFEQHHPRGFSIKHETTRPRIEMDWEMAEQLITLARAQRTAEIPDAMRDLLD